MASDKIPDDCGQEAVFEKTEYRSEPTGRCMTLKRGAQYLTVVATEDGSAQGMRFKLCVSIQKLKHTLIYYTHYLI